MRAVTLICAIASLIAVGLSAATYPWYITAIWSLTASIWAFGAGVVHTSEAWKDEL